MAALCSCAGNPSRGLQCVEAQQYDAGGQALGPSGWEYCTARASDGRGSYRRVDPVACASGPATTNCPGTAVACAPGQVGVVQDGYECACFTPCASDGDCAGDEACVCVAAPDPAVGAARSTTAANVCMPATCRSSADCDGLDCSLDLDECDTPRQLACHAPGDECAVDGQCPRGRCAYDATQESWGCGDHAICE